jgi:hypothetical protein
MRKFIFVKKLILIIISSVTSLCAQDTIRFTNGNATPVKVNEIGDTEIKYNRWDNITGPVYVCAKSEVLYIRYVNGMKDTFAVAKPKAEIPVHETPGYVNSTPQQPAFQQIIFVHKRLYYDHHRLNDKSLLVLIRKHPDQGVQNLMLKDYSKISVYKNNRTIGLFMLYGGIATTLLSGRFGSGAGGALLIGTAAGISGSIIAVMNKNKCIGKRREIARAYNGGISQ